MERTASSSQKPRDLVYSKLYNENGSILMDCMNSPAPWPEKVRHMYIYGSKSTKVSCLVDGWLVDSTVPTPVRPHMTHCSFTWSSGSYVLPRLLVSSSEFQRSREVPFNDIWMPLSRFYHWICTDNTRYEISLWTLYYEYLYRSNQSHNSYATSVYVSKPSPSTQTLHEHKSVFKPSTRTTRSATL